MEIVLNADADPNLIQRCTLTQDFREVHSKCWILCPFPAQADFKEGYGFVYGGQEWEAVSYKRVNREGGSSFLSILGYPKGICSVISTKQKNLSDLASSISTRLVKGSTNFNFEFPLRNVVLGPLLYKYRYASLEQNANHPELAWFLFYDERGVLGCTYSDLAKSSILEYNMDSTSFMGGSYSFVRDYLVVRYNRDQVPSKVHYKNWIGSLIGDKFDVKSNIPGFMGFRYKITGGDEVLFKKYDKLVLVRQKFDSTKQPLPWTLTFGQLNV